MVVLVLAFTPLCVSLIGAAEKPARHFDLRGQVITASGLSLRWTFARVMVRAADHPFSKQTTTNLQGRFRVKKLKPGTYIVTVNAGRQGRASRSLDVSESFADPKQQVHGVFQLEPYDTDTLNRVSVSQLSIPPKAWDLYNKAQKKLGKGKTDEAVQELEKALRLTPGFPAALNNLGTIAFQAGRFAEARHYFEKSLKYDPDFYASLVNLGGALVALQAFEPAREINGRATQKRPDDPLAHAQLGLSYEGLGQLEESVDSFTTSKQLEPGHFSYPQLPLARVYLRMGRRQAAIQELHEFLEIHPDSANADGVRQLLGKLETLE